MSKVLIRMVAARSPGDQFRGMRFQATTPNKAGKKFIPVENKKTGDMTFRPTGQVVPSFQKPYLVAETYGGPTELTRADYDRFLEKLKWEGFTEFEPYGEKCKSLVHSDSAEVVFLKG